MGNKFSKVTVITPYYKGMNTIFSTVDSVLNSARLCNDLDISYVIIIDSMEDKKDIVEKIKKRYGNTIKVIENEENIGVARSRNKALVLTDFDYVLFLDQDDFIDINYFTAMSRGIIRNADLIVSNAYVINSKNKKKVKMYYKEPKLTLEAFLKGNKILTPGQVLFSKKIVKIKNLFTGCSDEFKGADDWASYINIFLKFRNVNVAYINEPIFYYNIHENNYSKNWKELNMSAIKTAEFFMDKLTDKDLAILQGNIDFLNFENKYKDPNYKFNVGDLRKIINYYSYSFFDYNKLRHFIGKRLVGFNK